MLSTADTDARPALRAGLFELAPAKINLALHVVGRRADGYHLLESIVTFADQGDRVDFSASETDRFSISGRFADALHQNPGSDNLVTRARDGLRRLLQDTGLPAPPVAIALQKNLPVASGMGGGSADAAATLRGLMRHWGATLPEQELDRLALTLGADVPMCLRSQPLVVRGIGEDVTPLRDLPALALVLGNPLVGVGTPEIFRRLEQRQNPPLAPRGDRAWSDFLPELRNDLEPPARALVPEISLLSDMIRDQGALLVRMTGSGATCFGMFATVQKAQDAADVLSQTRPDWYFQAVRTLGQESETRP